MLYQWFIRTIVNNDLSHPMSCCFGQVFQTNSEASTLDEAGKVLPTL